jgi:hypothetical protein
MGIPCRGVGCPHPSKVAPVGKGQQKCFAHFLKELGKLCREKKRGAVRFPRALAQVLREALALREEKLKLDEASFQARVQEVEAKLDGLIAESRRFRDPDNARFAKRLRKQRRHLLRLLPRYSNVPCS